ncbi:MAG: hypothetical protein KC549_09165, partial [Myxococcales bacterium]|nr:hypothetical protein [Myxococcales bacterium]
STAPGTPPGCAAYAPPETTGHLAEAGLGEVSGIAVSRQSPGVLWLHNDSGDDPVLYATGEDGAALGRLTIPEAGVLDLEDVAIARCPGVEGWCLWAADVGDNGLNRPAVAIYAVREPAVAGPFAPREAEVVQRYIVRYPDGAPHDAEALAVAPGGDRFWLFSKVEGADPHVYEWATDRPGPGALTDLGAFTAPGVPVPMGKLVTGADLDPSGYRLALRVYTGSYEYTLPAAGDLSDLAALSPRTIAVGPLSEPQGEAIAYAADGLAVWTISEDQAGGQPLHRYGCRE